jgi:ABC-2 type transport system ATP-binding protein
VAPAETAVIVGADGAGKTTCTRALVGLARPTAGRVRRPDRRGIGYQPEAAGTWADLTVAENLDFVATAHRMGRQARGRIDSLVEVTGLSGATDRLAGRLSGGMRQKLAVAMAMLPRPELVVLDEPTTGLDPLSRADVWRLLARAAAEGAAVAVTTTYLDEAERAARVVVLDEGKVLVAGTAESIRASFPGAMYTTSSRPEGSVAWRRGRVWRVWVRQGGAPEGASAGTVDLEDVVTAAASARRETSS